MIISSYMFIFFLKGEFVNLKFDETVSPDVLSSFEIFSFYGSKISEMTLGLARTFAPNFDKVEKKVKADGTVETMKLSGLKY